MTAVALVLSLVFFAVAFVWRSLVQWRRTGDAGFRLHHSAGVLPRLASVLMVGGFLMTFAGVIGDLLDAGIAVAALDRMWLRATGMVVMVAALMVTVRAQLDLRESWRIGVDRAEQTELITEGLFDRVRNPIFTGMLAFAAGAALAVPSWLAIAGATLVAIGLEVQVRGVEEPYLRDVHGASYASYTRRVGRFVPGVGRTRTHESRVPKDASGGSL